MPPRLVGLCLAASEEPTPSDDTRMIHILMRLHYLPEYSPTFEQLWDNTNTCFFGAVLMDPDHVLHQLLPQTKPTHYSPSTSVIVIVIVIEHLYSATQRFRGAPDPGL